MWFVCKNYIELFHKNAHPREVPMQCQILIDGPMTVEAATKRAYELIKTKQVNEHYTIIEMRKE